MSKRRKESLIPKDQGGVKDSQGDNNSHDDTRSQAQNGIRVREGHDSQTNVLGKE